MRGWLVRSRRARVLVAATVALISTSQPMVSAQVGFAGNGPFEACLDGAVDAWVREQAELSVNEDPRAQQIDDASVADWAMSALEGCRRKAGSSDAASEARFTGYMSRWRDHVFDLASAIRRRGASD